MKVHFLLILMVACTVCELSCKNSDCEKALKTVNDISADAFGKLPYTGTDTLYFVEKSGDTSIVVGQGKVRFYEESKESIGTDCFNETLSQAFKISYQPVKGDLYFEVFQKARGKNIVVNAASLPVNFYIDYVNIGEHHPLNKDSISINNVVYTNVSTATPKDVTFSIIDHTYLCYYNQPYGVLRIKSEKESKEYSLIKKP